MEMKVGMKMEKCENRSGNCKKWKQKQEGKLVKVAVEMEKQEVETNIWKKV